MKEKWKKNFLDWIFAGEDVDFKFKEVDRIVDPLSFINFIKHPIFLTSGKKKEKYFFKVVAEMWENRLNNVYKPIYLSY